MLDRRTKVLIAGDFGTGKSLLALSFSEHTAKEVLAIDFERGMDHYLAASKEQAKGDLLWVRRVVAPSLYELKLLLQRIRDPQKPAREIIIDRKPVDPNYVSDRVKQVSADIATGKLVVGTIIVDTVTRLGDIAAARVFEESVAKIGLDKTERLTQLLWARAKDEVSELLFAMIEADLNVLLTAWAKEQYDSLTRQRTGQVIADVLKNVNAFVDLSLMLEPNARPAGSLAVAPKAVVQKSRLRNLPVGSVIQKATWPAIFTYEPKLEQLESKEEKAA